jgi:hypothetical protein
MLKRITALIAFFLSSLLMASEEITAPAAAASENQALTISEYILQQRITQSESPALEPQQLRDLAAECLEAGIPLSRQASFTSEQSSSTSSATGLLIPVKNLIDSEFVLLKNQNSNEIKRLQRMKDIKTAVRKIYKTTQESKVLIETSRPLLKEYKQLSDQVTKDTIRTLVKMSGDGRYAFMYDQEYPTLSSYWSEKPDDEAAFFEKLETRTKQMPAFFHHAGICQLLDGGSAVVLRHKTKTSPLPNNLASLKPLCHLHAILEKQDRLRVPPEVFTIIMQFYSDEHLKIRTEVSYNILKLCLRSAAALPEEKQFSHLVPFVYDVLLSEQQQRFALTDAFANVKSDAFFLKRADLPAIPVESSVDAAATAELLKKIITRTDEDEIASAFTANTRILDSVKKAAAEQNSSEPKPLVTTSNTFMQHDANCTGPAIVTVLALSITAATALATTAALKLRKKHAASVPDDFAKITQMVQSA